MLQAKRAQRAAYMRAYRKKKREEIDEVSISKQGKITAERKLYPREHIKQQFADGRRSNAEYMRAYRKRKAEQRKAESSIPLLIQASILEPVVEVEIKEEPFFLEQSPTDKKLESEKYKPLIDDKKKEGDECRNRMTPPGGLALEVRPDIKEQEMYSTDGHMKNEISFKMISYQNVQCYSLNV